MICGRCKKEICEEEAVPQGNQQVCEDCAMDLMSPAKACDPWAVKMAKGSFTSKADAAATLRGNEKALYDLVVERRRVPVEEASAALGVSKDGLQKVFSVLRHMELLRGAKRPDGGVDLLPFDS